jgi:AraC-like DNA-binding protein
MEQGEPVKAAAAATGFCDEFHFSRVFRRIEGMPPSRFVKALRG